MTPKCVCVCEWVVDGCVCVCVCGWGGEYNSSHYSLTATTPLLLCFALFGHSLFYQLFCHVETQLNINMLFRLFFQCIVVNRKQKADMKMKQIINAFARTFRIGKHNT